MGRRPAPALLDILRGEGVDRVFGNPGTTELPFLAALVDTEEAPEYVLGVHEGAVVSMADGYARATGRPAFVSLHIAAGLANGLIGLLNARRSRTPLVVMAGQQDRRHLQQDPMLSGDLAALAAPAVKATYDIQHARDLPLALRRAFALAVRPPAGPVFLSVPMDLLTEDTEVDVPARTPPPRPTPPAGLDRAAVLLGAATRPGSSPGTGWAARTRWPRSSGPPRHAERPCTTSRWRTTSTSRPPTPCTPGCCHRVDGARGGPGEDRRVEVLQDDAVLGGAVRFWKSCTSAGPSVLGGPTALKFDVPRVVRGALGAQHHLVGEVQADVGHRDAHVELARRPSRRGRRHCRSRWRRARSQRAERGGQRTQSGVHDGLHSGSEQNAEHGRTRRTLQCRRRPPRRSALSAATATRITPPVANDVQLMGTSKNTSPEATTDRIIAPATAPTTEPRPPASGVPPMMHAAMACNS